jgi:hypothetical protein
VDDLDDIWFDDIDADDDCDHENDIRMLQKTVEPKKLVKQASYRSQAASYANGASIAGSVADAESDSSFLSYGSHSSNASDEIAGTSDSSISYSSRPNYIVNSAGSTRSEIQTASNAAKDEAEDVEVNENELILEMKVKKNWCDGLDR